MYSNANFLRVELNLAIQVKSVVRAETMQNTQTVIDWIAIENYTADGISCRRFHLSTHE